VLYNLTRPHGGAGDPAPLPTLGLGVLPWSPLGGGLLGGALAKGEKGRRANERLKRSIEKHRAALEAYEALCRELGESPADVALAWLLGQPGVTAPIVGPRTMEQLDGRAPRARDPAAGRGAPTARSQSARPRR